MEVSEWLMEKLEEKRMTQVQLASLMGKSPAALNYVLTGRNNASAEFCILAARALNEPPETLLRIAGYFPALTPQAQGSHAQQELIDMMAYMDEEDKIELLELAKHWLTRIKIRAASRIARRS